MPTVPLWKALVSLERMRRRRLLACLRLPTAALRSATDGATIERRQNGTVEHVPKVHRRAVQIWEHDSGGWITSAGPVKLQALCKRTYYGNSAATLARFWFGNLSPPNRACDLDFPVPIAFPEKPTNFSPTGPCKRSDSKHRRGWLR